MKTVDLNKVLEMLVNEEQGEAAGLLHEWFVERSKQIHEELMSEDNSLSQDIEDDQEAIKSEEFYSEAEGDDESAEDETGEELDGNVDAELDGDVDADAEEVGGEEVGSEELSAEDTVSDTIEDLEAVMARLKAEFAEITGADVVGDETDAEMDGDVDGEVVDESTGDQSSAWVHGLTNYLSSLEDNEADGEDVDPAVKDFTKDAISKAKAGDLEGAFEAINTLDTIDADEAFTELRDAGVDLAAYGINFNEEVTESEDDFADLDESWTLEPVKDPNLSGGKEIGADGAKVSVNDKSPLPSHKAEARVGGKAVEIKSDHHEGHEREPAPEVKAKPLLKNQVKKATDGRTKVSKEGDKSAMLNSKAGFGSDSPKSPIGQATDLRGSDFKRK